MSTETSSRGTVFQSADRKGICVENIKAKLAEQIITAQAAMNAPAAHVDDETFGAYDRALQALYDAKGALEHHSVWMQNIAILNSRTKEQWPVFYTYSEPDDLRLRACDGGDFVSLQSQAQILVPNPEYPGDLDCPEPKYISHDCGWIERKRVTKSVWAEMVAEDPEDTDISMRNLMFND